MTQTAAGLPLNGELVKASTWKSLVNPFSYVAVLHAKRTRAMLKKA
jgi:hypothetical protein